MCNLIGHNLSHCESSVWGENETRLLNFTEWNQSFDLLSGLPLASLSLTSSDQPETISAKVLSWHCQKHGRGLAITYCLIVLPWYFINVYGNSSSSLCSMIDDPSKRCTTILLNHRSIIWDYCFSLRVSLNLLAFMELIFTKQSSSKSVIFLVVYVLIASLCRLSNCWRKMTKGTLLRHAAILTGQRGFLNWKINLVNGLTFYSWIWPSKAQ